MERRLLETQADHRQSAVDETYIRIKGKWRSLYRAVDSNGATLDFLLSAKQDAAAAKRFLAKEPRVIKHRQARRVSTRDRATQSRRCPCRGLPTMFWSRTTGPSNAECALAKFSLLLGCLAHDRRL
jgi:transposase-like protein